MEVSGLAAIGDPRDLVNRAVVTRLHFVGIFDNLVDEVTEVQDKTELIRWLGTLVLEDHPPVAVERAFIDVLTTHKREIDRARIFDLGRGDGSADAAAVTFGVG